MTRCFTILEVSQKQNYIFASNKLKDNIVNSAVIAYVLGAEYIREILQETSYSEEQNMVYSGGGHTILVFDDEDTARKMVSILTEKIYREFDGLMVFAKSEVFDEKTQIQECLKKLTESLERKKSVRLASFHQGSYGIERVDANTLDVIAENSVSDTKKKVERLEYDTSVRKYVPDGYRPVYQFEHLGGSKNDSNFIAVVHIDGNGMGKRVEELYDTIGEKSWEDTKRSLREFSDGIDDDFKAAYREMTLEVARNLQEEGLDQKLSLRDHYFPVRRVITAGDDICFVAEGRIGIECARIFIQKLEKKENKVDHRGYSACAGVAIVHQKYPFYRAYELAEMLCSNAKKYGAKISPADNGRSISAIDWHIEFGELKDSLKEIRQEYITADRNRLELRPYIVSAPEEILSDDEYSVRRYDNFKRIIHRIQDNEETYGNGKLKELRGALKKGETATRNYLVFNQMEDILIENRPGHDEITEVDLMQLFSGKEMKGVAFVPQADDKKYSILYDSIELMDSFIALEGGE